MKVIHKIQITAAKPNKIDLYHGTSSKFLKSILKNGLDPSKITEGLWQKKDYRDLSPSTDSLESYGGIYLAENFTTAQFYSRSAADRFPIEPTLGARPLIVLVKSHDRLIPDEDRMKSGIAMALTEAIHGVNSSVNKYKILQLYVRIRLGSESNPIKDYPTIDKVALKTYAYLRKNWNIKNTKLPSAKKIIIREIRDTVISYVERQTHFILKDDYLNYIDNLKNIVYSLFEAKPVKLSKYLDITKNNDRITHIKMKSSTEDLLKVKSIHDVEEAHRKNINTLMLRHANRGFLENYNKITKYTKALQNGDTVSNRTFRVLKPIKFKGRTRICGILQVFRIRDFEEDGKIISQTNYVLVYGKLHGAMATFIETRNKTKYDERGKVPRHVILDKNGKVLVEGQPIPSSLIER